MANSDVGTKTGSVKADTSMYGQKSIRNSSPQLDLTMVKAKPNILNWTLFFLGLCIE